MESTPPSTCWQDPGACAGSAGTSLPAGGQAPSGGSGGASTGGTPSAGMAGSAAGEAPGGTNGMAGAQTGGGGTAQGGSSAGQAGAPTAGKSTSGGTAGSGTAGAATSGAPSGGGGTAGSGTSGAPSAGSAGAATTCPDGSMPANGDCCPSDPNKTMPGKCGCGVADTMLCLSHRYSFSGSGTQVMDSVGSANGTVTGTTLSGGSVAFAGGASVEYVSLPAGILSQLTNVTLEAWVNWDGGTSNWQRIFDFGSSDAGAGESYLFLTPRNSLTQHVRVAHALSGPTSETFVDGTAPLPSGAVTHVAVVVDSATTTLALYVNGTSQGSTDLSAPLSSITDENNWLGRSQFSDDPYFAGSMQEFRIYAVARTGAQVQASFTAGPDALPAQ